MERTRQSIGMLTRQQLWYPAALFLAIAALSVAAWWTTGRNDANLIEVRTQVTTNRAAEQLQSYIADRIAIVAALKREWRDGSIRDVADFKRHALDRISSLGGYQAINWIDQDLVIRWVVPLEGNERAVNTSLRDHPIAGPVLARAIESGRSVLSPPLSLLQSGPGFVAYIPVESGKEGTLEGVLNVVFRSDQLVDSCIGNAMEGRFRYSLTDQAEPIHTGPDEESSEEISANATVSVLDRNWTLHLWPTDAFAASLRTGSNELFLILGLFAASLSALGLARLIASQNQSRQRAAEDQAMYQAYPDIQAHLRDDGTIVRLQFGPAATAEKPARDYEGRPLREFVHGDAAEALMDAVRQARETGLGNASYAVTRDGHRNHFDARVVTLTANESIAFIRDVSAETEAKLVQRGRFAVFDMLSAGAPLDAIITRLVTVTEDAVPGMIASVLLLDPVRRTLRHCAAPHLPVEYCEAIDGLAIGPTVGSCGAAASCGRRVIVEDVLHHSNWAPFLAVIKPTGLRACWSQPIQSADGTVLGTFAMYYREPRSPRPNEIDMIEAAARVAEIAIARSRALEVLRDREARLAEAQHAAHLASWQWQPDTGLTWSREMASVLGVSPETLPSLEPLAELIHPDDLESVRRTLTDAVTRQIPFSLDHRIVRQDRSDCHVYTEGRPELGADGAMQRWFGHVQDISERKTAEKRLRLMMAELDHRVKNVLASVLALTEQSAAGARDVDAFTDALTGRIRSLANTHAALSESRWIGADLADLAHLVLDAFIDARSNRISMEGDPCRLPAAVAPAFCLALHELMTNASKYGALSGPDGRLELTWAVRDETLFVDWREYGGPPIDGTPSSGFGTMLIQGFLEHELRGNAEMHFAREGLRCRLTVPLAEVAVAELASEPSK